MSRRFSTAWGSTSTVLLWPRRPDVHPLHEAQRMHWFNLSFLLLQKNLPHSTCADTCSHVAMISTNVCQRVASRISDRGWLWEVSKQQNRNCHIYVQGVTYFYVHPKTGKCLGRHRSSRKNAWFATEATEKARLMENDRQMRGNNPRESF